MFMLAGHSLFLVSLSHFLSAASQVDYLWSDIKIMNKLNKNIGRLNENNRLVYFGDEGFLDCIGFFYELDRKSSSVMLSKAPPRHSEKKIFFTHCQIGRVAPCTGGSSFLFTQPP